MNSLLLPNLSKTIVSTTGMVNQEYEHTELITTMGGGGKNTTVPTPEHQQLQHISIEDIIRKLHTVRCKNWSCVQCKRLYEKKNIALYRQTNCAKCILNYNLHLQFDKRIYKQFTTLCALNL